MTVDSQVIKLRLDKILSILEFLKIAAEMKEEEFVDNRMIRLATERSLQIAAQAVIDISTHLVAHNHWGTPESYKDSVDIISKNGIIERGLADNLIELVKLRNVIVHVYLEIDPKIVYQSVQQSISDLKDFVESIKKALSQ